MIFKYLFQRYHYFCLFLQINFLFLLSEETGCEEDPRQSLLHSANQQPPPIDSDVIEVVAADIEDSPEPEQV